MRILKESFNAGEFTPRLYSRYELAKFKNGCKTLTNFVPLPQGPITRRPGTQYIAAVKTSSKYTRLIPFEFSESDAYIIEFGDLYCRFYRNGAQLASTPVTLHLNCHFDGIDNSTTMEDSGTDAHTLTANGNAKLRTTNKKFGSASLYTNATADSVSFPDDAVFDFTAANWTIDGWVYTESGSDLYLFIGSDGIGAATEWSFLKYDQTSTTTGTVSFSYTSASDVVALSAVATAAENTWHHIAICKVGTEFGLYLNGQQIEHDTEAVMDADADTSDGFYLGKPITGGFECYVDEIRYSETNIFTAAPVVGDTDTITVPSNQYTGATVYEIVTTYTEASLAELQFVQSADTMYIVHKDFVVRKLVRTGHVSWAISNVSFTNAPAVWSAADYPRTIEFYEDRLCLGGSPDQPDTIWTTDSSDYTNFNGQATLEGITVAFVDSNPDTITDSGNGFVTAGFVAGMPITVSGSTSNDGDYTIATVAAGTITLIAADTLTVEGAGKNVTLQGGASADDDAITLTLLARRVNDIKWMSAGRRLIVGTGGEEWWVAGPSDTEPITPSDHIARKDSAWGSEAIMPVDVGDVIFYVQQNGKTLREMVYDYTKDKYISSDLNVLSEHLTREYSIIAMAYQQHPYQVLWCVREDGTILALTYLKEHEVVAWSKHTLGSGVVESVAVISGDPEDEVWFVVKRTVNSVIVRYIEKLKPFNFGTALEDAFFVDSGLTYNGPAATAISGLDHLEAEAVTVLADGAVVTGHTVASGAITLDDAASKIHIGLANTPELETLDVVAADDDGPLMGTIKRITNVAFRLVNSMGGLFGPDSDTTDSIHYRTETAPYTGWTLDKSFDEQDDVTSTVYVKCDEPLPMEIAAILIDLEDE